MVDTGVLIRFERRGREFAASPLASGGDSFMSAVTLSELLVGLAFSDTDQRRAQRRGFIDYAVTQIPVIAFTANTAEVHARIVADLRRSGRMIGAHDLIIAATAIAHGHAVLTTNRREFERVHGLEVIEFPLT